MQWGLSLVPAAVRSGHHISAATTKTWTLHHSLPPSSAYCPLSSKDLLMFISYLPSLNMTLPYKNIQSREEAKGPSSHTILSHIRKKAFAKDHQKNSPYMVPRPHYNILFRKTRELTLGSVLELIFVSPQIYILKPNP